MDISRRNKDIVLLMCSLTLAACAPRIHNIEPYAAPPGGLVAIQGECLTSGSGDPVAVMFNGLSTGTFTSSGSTVQATVPPGANTGKVTVQVAGQPGLWGCNAGIAESPHDFTVVTQANPEQEPNNSQQQATVFSGNAVTGSLGIQDVDWFRVGTGAAGAYGYALELHLNAQPVTNGIDVRVAISTQSGDTIDYLYSDSRRHVWLVQPPQQNIYLEVSWVGSTSSALPPIPYQIILGKLPIRDPGETGDNETTGAHAIEPGTPVSTAHLCSVEPGAYGDIKDHYAFQLNAPQEVMISVTKAGLPMDDKVIVSLLTPSGDNFETEYNYCNSGDTACQTRASSHVMLFADLPKHYKDTPWTFPQGKWHVLVQNHSGDFATSGSGFAPLSCKYPYTVGVSLQ